jgi:hypothetical protein
MQSEKAFQAALTEEFERNINCLVLNVDRAATAGIPDQYIKVAMRAGCWLELKLFDFKDLRPAKNKIRSGQKRVLLKLCDPYNTAWICYVVANPTGMQHKFGVIKGSEAYNLEECTWGTLPVWQTFNTLPGLANWLIQNG